MYLFNLSPIRFLTALLFIFSATAASASEPADTTARTMEIHIENGEQSLDASKQTSTMKLDGANLTLNVPDGSPCYRGHCENKTVRATLSAEQLDSLWTLAQSSTFWRSVGEDKPLTEPGTYTRLTVKMNAAGKTMSGRLFGTLSTKRNPAQRLSNEAQSYRRIALDIIRLARKYADAIQTKATGSSIPRPAPEKETLTK